MDIGQIIELGTDTAQLMKVHDIDWTDFTLHRAGIIPIYDDGTHKWIGFGVSCFSANITPIGGDYEPGDYDLLATAVREYNEEVGPNMPNITEGSLYDCYAVKSNYTIQILLPLTERPIVEFVPTKELHDILWVTPHQLMVMSNKQDYMLPGRFRDNSKGFPFAASLRGIAQKVAKVVSEGMVFVISHSSTSFNRPRRAYRKSTPLLVTDMNKFRKDAQFPGKWALTALTINRDSFGIMREDRTIYMFSIIYLDEVIFTLNKINLKVYVSTMADKIYAEKTFKLDRRVGNSLEYSFISLTTKYGGEETIPLMNNFLTQLNIVRQDSQTESISNECNLILDHELKLYDFVDRKNAFFNARRAHFLHGMFLINTLLSQSSQGLPYWSIKNTLKKHKLQGDLAINVIVNQMIALNLLQQHHPTTYVYIPRQVISMES